MQQLFYLEILFEQTLRISMHQRMKFQRIVYNDDNIHDGWIQKDILEHWHVDSQRSKSVLVVFAVTRHVSWSITWTNKYKLSCITAWNSRGKSYSNIFVLCQWCLAFSKHFQQVIYHNFTLTSSKLTNYMLKSETFM